MNGSVEHLLTNFTLLNSFNTEKTLPPCAIILNRNINMSKGVNKILKLIVAVGAEDPEATASFMLQHLPIGLLDSHNVICLFKFL